MVCSKVACLSFVLFRYRYEDSNHMPHGWHTLDIECKGVLSIGV